MGSVRRYETAAGVRWRVSYRKPDRTQTDKRGFKTKGEAEKFLHNVESSKDSGTYIDPTAARMTVGDLGALWRESRTHLKPSTSRVEDSVWRTHVLPKWGKTSVGAISHSDVQTWVAKLDLSPTMARQAHAILSAVLETALRDRRITTNPASGIRLPRKTSKARVYLTHAQVQALADHSGKHAPLVLFLAYTGLRWGEATGLRVQDLDVARRRVNVRENAVAVGGKIIVGTPKSHKIRSVPFSKFLAADLSAAAVGKPRTALLFGDGENHQRSPGTRDGWYAIACRKARADDPSFPAHITLHDLRHTAASLSISSGANVKAVQRMLGHASAAMTLDTYADLFDDDLDAVADALDDARSRSVVGKTWASVTDFDAAASRKAN